MRERVEKLRSERGFTLVELLAVIVILGIILAFAIPAIASVIQKSKEDGHHKNIGLIVSSARIADAADEFPVAAQGTSTTLALSDLVDLGYLERIPVNPLTKNEYPDGDVTRSIDGDNKVTFSVDDTILENGDPKEVPPADGGTTTGTPETD